MAAPKKKKKTTTSKKQPRRPRVGQSGPAVAGVRTLSQAEAEAVLREQHDEQEMISALQKRVAELQDEVDAKAASNAAERATQKELTAEEKRAGENRERMLLRGVIKTIRSLCDAVLGAPTSPFGSAASLLLLGGAMLLGPLLYLSGLKG